MTNEEKLKILLEREERAYELLRTLEPTDPAFGTCLDNARRCYYLCVGLAPDYPPEPLCFESAGPAPEVEEGKDEELKGITDRGVGDEPGHPGAATWEPGGGEAVEEEPAPADAPAQEEAGAEAESPATNEDPQLTQVEVRDRLSAVSIKHGSEVVTGAMAEMGFSKLSQIPAERYAELLDKVEEAVRCRQ